MWTSPKPPFFKAFGLRALQRASMKLQLRSVGLAVLETQREAVLVVLPQTERVYRFTHFKEGRFLELKMPC